VGVFDAETMRTVARQRGVVTRRQLIEELGWSAASVGRARRKGVLVELAPSVLCVASQNITFATRCLAAILACGDAGFLSAGTAGRLYGLRKMPTERIHLTVPHTFRSTVPSFVDVHRTRWFDPPRDVLLRPDGLRVATPLRMLFGLAAEFTQFRFERAAEDAWHLGLITPDQAMAYLEAHRCRGKNGVSTMERWLERCASQARPSQSDLERELLDALDRMGLPPAVRQHPLALHSGETIHFDIAWPLVRLAVEPGHSWWHGGDARQRVDQARDRACSELGWLVVRFDETMRHDANEAARQVCRIHAQRRRDLNSVPNIER